MPGDNVHHAPKQERNGQSGRDSGSGRFKAGNQFGRVRRRPKVPMPPLPHRLRGHGFDAVWQMLCIVAGNGGPGSAAAMRLVVDLSLGRIKPTALPSAQPVDRRGYAASVMPLYEEDDIEDDVEFDEEGESHEG